MPAKSQWEFGELFPTQPTRRILSVAQLTAQIRQLLEKQVGLVWVMGEVTNFKLQPSGHIYFTLKDAAAQLSCVLFRGEAQVDRGLLQDGRNVCVRGEISVYEPRGQYQLRVLAVELQGLGALQAAFEKLKQKLNAEGLFDRERKRPLPRYPQCIGLVTSPAGAAMRDVLHAVRRRHPGLQILLAPCRVQGPGAAVEIAAAIRLLNQFQLLDRRPRLDLILLTRGGGSLEDLWAFNEETVARAIFHSQLPVVSAVGHEIDYTISDFVADVRAATPSAAAEIITEGFFSSAEFVAEAGLRMRQLMHQQFLYKAELGERLAKRLQRLHPRRLLNDRLQRVDDLQSSLIRCAQQALRRSRIRWQHLAERLGRVRPAVVLRQRRALLDQVQQRLRELSLHRLDAQKNRLASAGSRLRLLGPEQVLSRGYSITIEADSGSVVRDPKQLRAGQRLKSHLQRGQVFSRVEEEPQGKTTRKNC